MLKLAKSSVRKFSAKANSDARRAGKSTPATCAQYHLQTVSPSLYLKTVVMNPEEIDRSPQSTIALAIHFNERVIPSTNGEWAFFPAPARQVTVTVVYVATRKTFSKHLCGRAKRRKRRLSISLAPRQGAATMPFGKASKRNKENANPPRSAPHAKRTCEPPPPPPPVPQFAVIWRQSIAPTTTPATNVHTRVNL